MIFLFSGTGNSYAVAKRISDEFGNGMRQMASAVRYERYAFDAEGEDVGFVFPTYFLGLPSTVEEFAKNVNVRNPGRVFCVSTCSADSGGACDRLAELLGPRLKVDAMYDVLMPSSAVFASDPPTEEEAAGILEGSDGEIESIVESLRNREEGDLRRHRGEGDWREAHGRYDEVRTTGPFALSDACIECRICEEICPTGTIKVYHRKPVWDEESCALCMSCVQLCPKRAIDYGEGTRNRGRYRHPLFYERSLGVPFSQMGVRRCHASQPTRDRRPRSRRAVISSFILQVYHQWDPGSCDPSIFRESSVRASMGGFMWLTFFIWQRYRGGYEADRHGRSFLLRAS